MNSIYVGKFLSLQEANTFVEKNASILEFPQERWLLRQSEFLEKALRKEKPREENLSRLVSGQKKASIVDFGGGSGWVASYLGEECYIQYRIVETDKTIEFFSKINRSKNLFWEEITNLESNQKFDILYSNSAIQYPGALEDFMEILSQSVFDRVLLDDIQSSSEATFWTCQKYYGYLVPVQIISEAEIELAMLNLGYICEAEYIFNEEFPADWKLEVATINSDANIIVNPKSKLFRKLN